MHKFFFFFLVAQKHTTASLLQTSQRCPCSVVIWGICKANSRLLFRHSENNKRNQKKKKIIVQRSPPHAGHQGASETGRADWSSHSYAEDQRDYCLYGNKRKYSRNMMKLQMFHLLLGGRPHPHQVGLPRGGREHQGPEGPRNTRGTCPRRMAMLSDGHLNFISFF